MKGHKRGDRVYVIGSGSQASVEKIAACRCGARDSEPRGDLRRATWWREHIEKMREEKQGAEGANNGR